MLFLNFASRMKADHDWFLSKNPVGHLCRGGGVYGDVVVYAVWTAISQLHLQSLPLEQQPSCGAPWTFRLQGAPLFDWYEPIIRGYGQCGTVEYFLSVPFAWWSLLACAFILLGLWGGWWVMRHHEIAE